MIFSDILGALFHIVVFCVLTNIIHKVFNCAFKSFSIRRITVAFLNFLITIIVMRLIPLFKMTSATQIFPLHVLWEYIIFAIVGMILWAGIECFINKKMQSIPRRKQSLFTRIIVVVCLLVSVFLTSGSIWFKIFYGNLSPEQFIFNLQSPIVGTADTMMLDMVFCVVFPCISSILIIILFLTTNKSYVTNRYTAIPLLTTKKIAILTTVFVVSSIVLTIKLLRLDQIGKLYVVSSNFIEENYVDVRKVNPTFPDQKRNLIHIYLESVENSYFDESIGGYGKHNLMPELQQLSQEGISFSHNHQFGGPHQTYGSGWSVAAMVNMMSGIPLKVAMNGNDYGKSGDFLPGLYNLGNLLHDNGYNQTVMFGADATFGGVDVYFKSHGNFNIFDVKHARNIGLIPKNYNVWWGFEDEKLYTFAKDEILRLANENKPFHFVMENADTHFPHGYMDEKTPKLYQSQYANVIAHSSKKVVEFVRWIQSQPFYKNTTIVITGDHLSMDVDFFKNFDPKYHRTVYNLFLNAVTTTENTKNRQYSPMDFYPTILTSIGIKFDRHRVGLGTDLFSGEPTLIEKKGIKYFNDELSKNSHFYNKHFFKKRKNK